MDRNANTFYKVYTFLSRPDWAESRPDGDGGWCRQICALGVGIAACTSYRVLHQTAAIRIK